MQASVSVSNLRRAELDGLDDPLGAGGLDGIADEVDVLEQNEEPETTSLISDCAPNPITSPKIPAPARNGIGLKPRVLTMSTATPKYTA